MGIRSLWAKLRKREGDGPRGTSDKAERPDELRFSSVNVAGVSADKFTARDDEPRGDRE